MTISKRIRQIREESGETQVQTARAIGCTAQALSNLERGCNNPPIKMLCALAGHFGTSTDYILGLSEERCLPKYSPPMTEDEADLLNSFRKMDKSCRRILLGTMEELSRRTEEKRDACL